MQYECSYSFDCRFLASDKNVIHCFLFSLGFSAANTFSDAYSTDFVGGECTQGLRLRVEVLGESVNSLQVIQTRGLTICACSYYRQYGDDHGSAY